jgi:DNA-binding NarL/FixJ family response regulator
MTLADSSQSGTPRRGREGDSGSQPVRVLIVDDHPAVRTSLAGVLDAAANLEPIASVATASDAATQARRLAPHVAIVDYRLPGRDGLLLTIELKRLPQPPRVLIYSGFVNPRLTIGAIIAGADGIVTKSSTGEDLCAAVRSVATGLHAMPDVPPHTLNAIAAQLETEDLPILYMLMKGLTPAEAAEALDMTEEWLAIRRWAMLTQVAGSPRGSI